MDPASISGLAMAGLTLPAQVFTSGAITYTTISQVRTMGNSLGKHYWRFKIQENRFIFWGMSHKACSPGGLDPNHMPKLIFESVVNTLIQINGLLGDRDKLCERYGLQEVGEVRHIELSVIKRESMRQQNMVKRLQKSSSLLRKVQWAVKDQSRFSDLVQELTEFNNTLYEMLPVLGGAVLEGPIIAQTLADELVNTGSLRAADGLLQTTDIGLSDLRQTYIAMSSALRRDSAEAFTLSGQPTPPSPHLLLDVQYLEFPDRISIPNPAPDLRSWARPRQNNPFSSADFMVVEWLRYDLRRNRAEDVDLRAILQARIEALAQMLKEKPRSDSFRVLNCVGYVEDNTDSRFGLTFRFPNISSGQQVSVPRSLYETITKYPYNTPYLGDRFRLAYLLAESVHAFLATGWLHKSICSYNILLFPGNSQVSQGNCQHPVSLDNPYFTGFALSRPDDPNVDSSRSAAGAKMAIYRHPQVQGFGGKEIVTYRAIHDIYSLGTMLLEIATWRTMSRYYPSSPPPGYDFKAFLLEKVVPGIGVSMGERYMTAVRKCLDGSFEKLDGFSQDEYDSADYKENLRQGFFWEVVSILRDCRA
ncbi:uncharacterized protein BP5553_03747 [Venustampulla echinocandica]|uniref:Prion-inhibition and propagation HeLo domain-containing protein n=1 Tax=Venustampulla echinocandica TaxID=2656787 RepID=A0A370TV42_9HELO|nr:uncharacterized protein BP5553_03747 [Venustampulla echinocandica]RDL39407.1 hypothetical protein BP5553_03747 [Venustampulla echinocandica]